MTHQETMATVHGRLFSVVWGIAEQRPLESVSSLLRAKAVARSEHWLIWQVCDSASGLTINDASGQDVMLRLRGAHSLIDIHPCGRVWLTRSDEDGFGIFGLEGVRKNRRVGEREW